VSRAASAGSKALDEQVDGPLSGHRGEERVDAALEALRRLGGEPVPARGARDRDRVEVRGLDEHVGRRCADLRLGAAHDPGEAEGARAVAAGGVRDEEVADVERALGVVEGRQPLGRPRPTHDDRRGERVEVVGVQGLPEVEHHVVRHVDRQ
jgi:hypothetical protein